jgi:predicted Holliday junction resolvase-like endonuclease
MSTGLIVAIVVVVALVLLALVVLVPRMRRAGAQRRMDQRRGEAADLHREEAEERALRADAAEREARVARAEADLHESRAEMHERGLADDALPGSEDRRFERDRELIDDRPADPVEPSEPTRSDLR